VHDGLFVNYYAKKRKFENWDLESDSQELQKVFINKEIGLTFTLDICLLVVLV